MTTTPTPETTPLPSIPTAYALWTEANRYLQQSVAPLANTIDADPQALAQAFRGLGDRNLLALRVPKSWGGAGLNEADFQQFQMSIARYSGALAFLQTQHQTAGNMIAASDNHKLKATYLPQMASGQQRLVGMGIAQLRRAGKPSLTAIPTDEGYWLSGTVPWITGWGIFKEFGIGAILPSGEEVYGLVPLEATQQATGGTIAFSPPLALSAVNSGQTVVGELKNWRLDRDRVLFPQPVDAMRQRDRNNVLYLSFLALGCAQAGLDIVERVAQQKPIAAIALTHGLFQAELERLIDQHLAVIDPASAPFPHRLQLRGSAIHLAGRCAQAAIIAASGAANVLSHPAQRVYREAMLFSVTGQTAEVMAESLGRLIAGK
jgi:alkylation response protein AidB-like acyl-CoA dehydrogenase